MAIGRHRSVSHKRTHCPGCGAFAVEIVSLEKEKAATCTACGVVRTMDASPCTRQVKPCNYDPLADWCVLAECARGIEFRQARSAEK